MAHVRLAGPEGRRRVAAWMAAAPLMAGTLAVAAPAPPTNAAARQTAAGAVVGLAPTPDGAGYWIADEGGGVVAFGRAAVGGSEAMTGPDRAVEGMAATPDGQGYWLVGADGGVFAFGSAPFLGSMAATRLAAPVVGMAATPDGQGYWLAGADGGVFAFGSAPFLGSMAATRLAAPVVGMAAAPDGQGYWLVGADGGVFAFGSAPYLGSMAATRLAAPVVGMAATPDGQGYWLVGADGGVFAFGSAPYLGSMAATRLAAPVEGMAAAPDGQGYWLVGADGGVFAFGSAPYLGRRLPPNPARVRIGLYGDSLAWEAEPYFSYMAGGAGADVSQSTFGGTATCDALPAMAADARLHLGAAVVAFGGNAATPCMAGYPAGTPAFFAKYETDTVEAIRILTGEGAHVYLASAPPASTAAGSANLTVLNRMYATLASEYPGVTYIDAGRAVTRDGIFTWTLPCLGFEPCLGPDGTNVVRSPDGVHFCPDGHGPDWRCSVYPSGAFRYGLAMLGPVLRDLELRSADVLRPSPGSRRA